jgi:hypothetical protein
MALIEIEETELANYRQLADSYNKALQHPKARPLLIDAIAEVNPQVANAPDRMLRQQIAERDSALTEQLAKFTAAFEEREAKREEREQRAALEHNLAEGRSVARRSGYTDDGLKALEEFKAEHGILDYEDAIAAYERRNPPPTPVATGGNRWDFLQVPEAEAPDLKPLLEGNDDAWLNKTITQTLREVRGQ